MQQFPPALTPATRRGSTVTALLLVLVCAPVFAASGIDPLCDESITDAAAIDVSVDELSVDVVDHDTNSTHLIASDENAATILPERPSVEMILRQIFDETSSAGVDLSVTDAARSATAAPLVELNPPVLIVPPPQDGDAQTSNEPDRANPLTVVPRFPGLSEADTQRYRRQMYRTDI